jgi:hypothetical protein
VIFSKIRRKDFEIMQSDTQKTWAIFGCLSVKYVCVARFYNRRDAEDHLRFLNKRIPEGRFELVDARSEIQMQSSDRGTGDAIAIDFDSNTLNVYK